MKRRYNTSISRIYHNITLLFNPFLLISRRLVFFFLLLQEIEWEGHRLLTLSGHSQNSSGDKFLCSLGWPRTFLCLLTLFGDNLLSNSSQDIFTTISAFTPSSAIINAASVPLPPSSLRESSLTLLINLILAWVAIQLWQLMLFDFATKMTEKLANLCTVVLFCM